MDISVNRSFQVNLREDTCGTAGERGHLLKRRAWNELEIDHINDIAQLVRVTRISGGRVRAIAQDKRCVGVKKTKRHIWLRIGCKANDLVAR